MGLRAVFAGALPGIFTAAGEAAVFTPATGSPIPCFVFIDFNVMLQPSGMEAQVYEQGTAIEALLLDIGREPNRGETFTVGGVVYTVKAPISNDGLTVKCVVS
jgi:hypothetical protein